MLYELVTVYTIATRRTSKYILLKIIIDLVYYLSNCRVFLFKTLQKFICSSAFRVCVFLLNQLIFVIYRFLKFLFQKFCNTQTWESPPLVKVALIGADDCFVSSGQNFINQEDDFQFYEIATTLSCFVL